MVSAGVLLALATVASGGRGFLIVNIYGVICHAINLHFVYLLPGRFSAVSLAVII